MATSKMRGERPIELTAVQSEILRRAVGLCKEHNIKVPVKVRGMLSLEGYEAADIQTALLFWANREVELSGNHLTK